MLLHWVLKQFKKDSLHNFDLGDDKLSIKKCTVRSWVLICKTRVCVSTGHRSLQSNSTGQKFQEFENLVGNFNKNQIPNDSEAKTED